MARLSAGCPMLTKLLIVAVLLFIVFTLFRALWALMRSNGDKTAVVRTLTIRVALSVALFIALLLSAKMGWIETHGLR